MRRGQAMSFDFVTSVTLFISTMIIINFLWSTVTSDLQGKKDFDLIMLQALRSSELLVKNLGEPENWTASTVKVLGLAESENVLDYSKTRSFAQMVSTDYFKAKELLGLSDDFYFEVYDVLNDSIVYRAPQIVLDSYDNVASISRYALLNGSVVKMFFAVIK